MGILIYIYNNRVYQCSCIPMGKGQIHQLESVFTCSQIKSSRGSWRDHRFDSYTICLRSGLIWSWKSFKVGSCCYLVLSATHAQRNFFYAYAAHPKINSLERDDWGTDTSFLNMIIFGTFWTRLQMEITSTSRYRQCLPKQRHLNTKA